MTCGICFEETDIRNLVDATCFHYFCKTCWTAYLTVLVKEGRVSNVTCPSPACRRVLERKEIVDSLDPEMIVRYDKFLYNATMSLNPNARWCPTPDCGIFMVGDYLNSHLTCERCHREICWNCNREWHRGRCDIAAKGLLLATADDFNLALYLAGNSVRPCPSCASPIAKDGGCNHMRCRNCHYEFCWNCGWNWNSLERHSKFWSVFGCPNSTDLSFLGRDQCCCCLDCGCGCRLWFRTKRILFACVAVPLACTVALAVSPFILCYAITVPCLRKFC